MAGECQTHEYVAPINSMHPTELVYNYFNHSRAYNCEYRLGCCNKLITNVFPQWLI